MGLLSYFTGPVLVNGLLALTLLYLFYSIRSYLRLSHIPGPKLWGWTQLPLNKVHLWGEIYDTFGDLSLKYGSLVRIAPNYIMTSNPDVVRRMSAARSPYTRSDWYVSLRLIPGEDNVLSYLNDARHEELRRKMGMSYSGKENLTLEPDIDDCVRDLVKLFENKYIAKPGKSATHMDLAQKMQFFTSDVMSKLSLDAKLNDLRDDNDNLGYINEIETIFPSISCTGLIPGVMNFLTTTGILALAVPSDSSTIGLGKVLGITKAQVAKRFDADGKFVDRKRDMLGSFLRHGLTREEAEQEAVMQLGAGSDTTATGLRSNMLSLMKSPRVYAKLAAELDEAMRSGKISADPNAIISDEQARKLPYLQAVIKEGLRQLPPASAMLPKKVPAEGDTIDGYFVPGGTNVAWCTKILHHSKELFGPDEWGYRPERWIHTSEGGDEESYEKIKMLERNNELLFGSGRFQCLGKTVAAIELNKAVAEVVKRFELELVNPDKPWDTRCFGIHFQKNMWVTVRRRESALGGSKVEA